MRIFFCLFALMACTNEKQTTDDSLNTNISKNINDQIPLDFQTRRTNLAHINANVPPLLKTTWGQGGVWQQHTPLKDGEPTYPGCTTIASAQILYYYQYRNRASRDVCYSLDHEVEGENIDNNVLCLDFASENITYKWEEMAWSEAESAAAITATSEFIYHVGVTLNAQFGGGEGSSATGRQIENAFRYQWGYSKRREDNLRAKTVTVIAKDEFFDSDEEFAEHLRMELNAGRPVLYMAQQQDANTGHAFVIDGYSGNLFHVNWGWGGHGNGYYDLSMTDPSNRSWSRNALIYQYLEPTQDFALSKIDEPTTNRAPAYSWNGNGSLIGYASESKTGYGLTIDEAAIHPTSIDNPIVFFQWEIDQKDGTKLKFDADEMEKASITYGPWNDRSKDIIYEDVALPFILDPTKDGFSVADQEYYVIAVQFDKKPEQTTSVIAEMTTEDASTHQGVKAQKIEVDGHIWNGNGSLIGYSSGDLSGYGLEIDEGLITPQTNHKPIVFFQWEVDQKDGTKLQLDADGMIANISYGIWNDRTTDVTHTNVSLPFTIDPKSDGFSTPDGEYFVIKVAFQTNPSHPTTVEVKTKK